MDGKPSILSPPHLSTLSNPSFTVTILPINYGYRIVLPEYAPGCIYFWLLMAAGCGFFISEEALNIWVCPIYWGVCISDMIPFYLGKLFKQSGASDDVCSKLGISEEKVLSITSVVQKYGNLAGVVEWFSLGVRNPTAFLAGTMLGIGFLLRERPIFALAMVATVVGMWTVIPYVTAASTALFFYLQRCCST